MLTAKCGLPISPQSAERYLFTLRKMLPPNLTILRQNSSHPPVLLEPNQAGLGDRIDLWYAGYAVSIANKYPWAKPIQRFMKLLLKSIKFTTGLVIVPSLSLAIQKAKS